MATSASNLDTVLSFCQNNPWLVLPAIVLVFRWMRRRDLDFGFYFRTKREKDKPEPPSR